MAGGKITSKTARTVTHPIKGETAVPIEARIVDMRALPDLPIEYEGQSYTGVVLLTPEFSYTIGGQKFIDQMAPQQIALPFSVYENIRKTAIVNQALTGTSPERELESAVLVLRSVIGSYFKDENGQAVSLYGLASGSWNYAQ